MPFAVCFWWLCTHSFRKKVVTFCNFLYFYKKICSPLEQETHFWKPTLSNRPSNFRFLEHWRLHMIPRWAIFLALIASKLLFSPLFRFSRPSEFWKLVDKTCGFCTGSRPAKWHDLSHLQFCNFLMVSAFCCLLLLATHTFFCKNVVSVCNVFVFLQKKTWECYVCYDDMEWYSTIHT